MYVHVNVDHLCIGPLRSTVTDEGTDDIITSDGRTVAVAACSSATTRVDQTGTNVCGVEVT